MDSFIDITEDKLKEAAALEKAAAALRAEAHEDAKPKAVNNPTSTDEWIVIEVPGGFGLCLRWNSHIESDIYRTLTQAEVARVSHERECKREQRAEQRWERRHS